MSRKIFVVVVLIISVVLLGVEFTTGSSSALPPDGVEINSEPAQTNLYLVGSEIRISKPSTPLDTDRQNPEIAYNPVHEQYLVVWQNAWPGNKDIYGQRVSTAGELVGGWFSIATFPGGDLINPAVAYNAVDDEYLIVWMKEVSPDVYEIWGRIISWSNSYQKPEFKIISWANRSFYWPRVVWNSVTNQYFVVWSAFDTTISFPPGVPNDIAGAQISNTGTIVSGPIHITSYSGAHKTDITYNPITHQYFIAFVVIHTAATTGNDIYGMLLNGGTGSPENPPGLIKIMEYKKNQGNPAVAINGALDRYMVVWQNQYGINDHDIYGREYLANGNPDGSYFTISSFTQDDTVPDIAALGANREWLVVWQRALPSGGGYSIHGFRWGSAGSSVYTYIFDVVNWAFYECTNPVVTAGPNGYFIAYEEDIPPGKQHIYGRPWWAEAVYLPLIIR